MSKRKPVPPFLTLSEHDLRVEPVAGWEIVLSNQAPCVIPHGGLLQSWDTSLEFELRRRFYIDESAMLTSIGLSNANCRFRLVTRLETANGLVSIVADSQEVNPGQTCIEAIVKPDSNRLSRDIALVTSIVLVNVEGELDELAPVLRGSRVWQSEWKVKIEGGKTRLPMEVISFSTRMRGGAAPRALFQVSVAEYPELDFEQAVCVYLNSDYPLFVQAIERGEPAPTAMIWDAVIRQLLAYGLSSAFAESDADWPDGSIGRQLRSWMQMIFPGESPAAISATRAENPGLFEAKIQSWTNPAAFWKGPGS